LWLLAPELALLAAGLLALALDALGKPEARRYLPSVAMAGLAGALVATASLWGRDLRLGAASSATSLVADEFALAVNVVALAVLGLFVLVSAAAVQARPRQGAFYAALLLAALALCLLGAATDLVAFVLACELFSVAAYIIAGLLREGPRSDEAALKFFIYSALFTALLLYGLSWFYGLAGSTSLGRIAEAVRASEAALRPALLPALILVTVGLAAKIAAVPFHQWVPDVYEGAPAPVAAFLAVAPPIAGFTVLARLLLTALPADLQSLDVDWRTLLITLAVLTMAAGNLVALWQQNVKRLLAYAGIAQAGYVLVGLAAASPRGVAAMLFALLAYALGTLGAFAAVMAWAARGGSDAIADLAGMHRRAPEIAWPLLVCLLSLAGLPPLAGFFARMGLFSAAVEEGSWWLAAFGALNSVVGFACYWKIVHAAFIKPAGRDVIPPYAAAPRPLAVALWVAVIGVLAAFVFAGPLLALFEAAGRVLGR
jgi:proton-translocating NADH-quinone oxidoreductase chain N